MPTIPPALLRTFNAAHLNSWHLVPTYSANASGVCRCRRGEECPSPAKHPWNGVTNASPDPEQWVAWALAGQHDRRFGNWQVALGAERSGVVVIDLDRPRAGGGFTVTGKTAVYGAAMSADGIETWGTVQAEIGPQPPTLTVVSGGAGRHLFYRIPPGVEIESENGWRPGIDVKARSQLAVLPPSIHVSGRTYEWETDPAAFPVLPYLSDALIELLPRPGDGRARSSWWSGSEPPLPDWARRWSAYVTEEAARD